MITKNKDNNLWVITAKELLDIQDKLKFLKNKKIKIENSLRELSNNESASGEGFNYNLFSRPGSVNYASIPALKDLDLDQYRKEDINYWKLSFTKQFDI